MKEVSIEEKAKTYDGNYKAYTELINRLEDVKNAIKKQNYGIAVDILYKPYPEFQITTSTELKESDRVRKEIQSVIEQLDKDSTICGKKNDYNRWLAWLEKQSNEPNWCHHKVDLSNCSEEYCKAYYDGWNNCNMQHSQCRSELDDVVKCLINGMKFYYEDNEEATWGTDKWSMPVKHIIEVLEKQGEQKPVDHEHVNIRQKDFAPKSAMEAIKEEKVDNANKVENKDYSDIDPHFFKPIDKVEPKFKVGDWVVQGLNILKIRCVGNEYYCFETVGGYVGDMLVSEIDSSYHLWTIQDAKDGDVLFYKGYVKHSNGIKFERIVLFENLDKSFFVLTKCSNGAEDYVINANIDYPDNIIPATKEQKEILFMVMKEAGYEWDAEKKELRKIEQKPADVRTTGYWNVQEIPFGAKDSELMEATYDIPKGFHAEIDGNRVVIKKGEQKPAWSEDDENRINSLIAYFEYEESFTAEDDIVYANWLKSLKDRVLPQTKQEWSEEDKRKIDRIYSILREAADTHAFSTSCRLIGDKECVELQDFLRSLRPQNTWKPSDEQMEALESATENCAYSEYQDCLRELIGQLKKLKENNV